MNMRNLTEEEAITMAKAKLKCIQLSTTGKAELCHDCDNCNLNYDQGNMGEQKEWLAMAIYSLKKQKPRTPIRASNHDIAPRFVYGCPNCCQVVGDQNGRFDYCPDCGQRIDWKMEVNDEH